MAASLKQREEPDIVVPDPEELKAFSSRHQYWVEHDGKVFNFAARFTLSPEYEIFCARCAHRQRSF